MPEERHGQRFAGEQPSQAGELAQLASIDPGRDDLGAALPEEGDGVGVTLFLLEAAEGHLRA